MLDIIHKTQYWHISIHPTTGTSLQRSDTLNSILTYLDVMTNSEGPGGDWNYTPGKEVLISAVTEKATLR